MFDIGLLKKKNQKPSVQQKITSKRWQQTGMIFRKKKFYTEVISNLQKSRKSSTKSCALTQIPRLAVYTFVLLFTVSVYTYLCLVSIWE